MNIDKTKLVSDIKRLVNAKVLVVGDLAIDEMIYGDAERISREAPVLILQHTKTNIILGGASNAAHNVSTLNNGKVAVLGVFGEDYQSGQMLEAFEKANIDFSNHMSVITGETGAGKSLLIDAISLLSGQRSTSNVVRKDANKTILQMRLSKPSQEVLNLLEENDYDIIHINYYGPNSYALAKRAKKHGKKVVYHAHSTEEDFKNSFIFSNQISPAFKKWIIT